MQIIEILIWILVNFKDYFTDIVVVAAISTLVVYQIKQSRKISKSSEKSEKACNKILETQSPKIPSISRRMSEIVKSSATINRQLDKLVYELNADRGYVYLFHNSGYDLLGQPFAKITNTNESVSPGITSLVNDMKNIPVGVMACFIEKLLNDYEFKCKDIEQYKGIDQHTYSYLKSLGVKSTYSIMLFAPSPEVLNSSNKKVSFKDIPLGFIGVDFIKNKKELSDKEFRFLYDTSMTIKGLLIERQREEIESGNIKITKG